MTIFLKRKWPITKKALIKLISTTTHTHTCISHSNLIHKFFYKIIKFFPKFLIGQTILKHAELLNKLKQFMVCYVKKCWIINKTILNKVVI